MFIVSCVKLFTSGCGWLHTKTHCNTLQHTATHCNTFTIGCGWPRIERVWMRDAAYECGTSHMNEACHTWMRHVTHEWGISNIWMRLQVAMGGHQQSDFERGVSRMDEACHVWMRHVIYEWVYQWLWVAADRASLRERHPRLPVCGYTTSSFWHQAQLRHDSFMCGYIDMWIYIFIYIYIYMYIYMYIYIYISTNTYTYIWRLTSAVRVKGLTPVAAAGSPELLGLDLYMCKHIHIYMYVYVCMYMYMHTNAYTYT